VEWGALTLDEHVLILKTLADPTRLTMLKLLLDRELCVCELQPLLGISQPAVSQHIAKLRAARLVQERRAGMWTYYRADKERLLAGLGALTAFVTADLASLPELADVAARSRSMDQATLCGQKGAGCK
jgi:ArsR family transcriptional regulator